MGTFLPSVCRRSTTGHNDSEAFIESREHNFRYVPAQTVFMKVCFFLFLVLSKFISLCIKLNVEKYLYHKKELTVTLGFVAAGFRVQTCISKDLLTFLHASHF